MEMARLSGPHSSAASAIDPRETEKETRRRLLHSVALGVVSHHHDERPAIRQASVDVLTHRGEQTSRNIPWWVTSVQHHRLV